MNERELGKALLAWDAANATSLEPRQPYEQVAEVLRKDRRRVRLLAAGALALWLMAGIGIPGFFAVFFTWMMPKCLAITETVIEHSGVQQPQELAVTAVNVGFATMKLSIIFVTGAVAALLLAAGSTVWLVFATRRATLREVNANLAMIAERLKGLKLSGS